MFITLNHRLFLATGDGKYIDVMDRGMCNNALSGVTAAGDRFFYVNRLASAGDGRDTRWERASLECCPPNLVRFLAAMPGFVYAQDKTDAIYVNLYLSSEASFRIGGSVGREELALAVESEMPWGGKSRIMLSAKQAVRGAIKLRIPGWARNQPAPGTLYTYQHKLDKQPTRDELALMYRNLKATGAADFRADGLADNCVYWSSSQVTTDMARHIDFADAVRDHYDNKDFPRRVRAIRAF
jgi:hypothetical protein